MSERLLAYRFALDLNRAQEKAAWSHVGARRFAQNRMLEHVKANLDQRGAERSYGIQAEELTPTINWSAYTLVNVWNSHKREWAPWWAENSKESYADGCRRLAVALANWYKERRATKKGRAGFPKFASRQDRQSMTFTTGSFRVDDRRHVVLPRLGKLRTFEDTTRLLALVETGQARISRATLAFDRGRWFVSFTVHQHAVASAHQRRLSDPVGIDLGVKDLFVVAGTDGRELERIPAPRHLAEAKRRLRALQRKADRQIGPWDTATMKHRKPSSGWRRTQTRIARVHARVANLREDSLHQVTTRITRTYGHIVIEDLNVRGMTKAGGRRRRALNAALKDASFAKIARMLSYKTGWSGGTLTRADRFFPSSKTCSGCGTVKAKLSLAERTYRCEQCGAQIDRDLNAAINLARYTAGKTAGVPGRDASGATRKSDPVSVGGYETGTCPAGAPPRNGWLHDSSSALSDTRVQRNNGKGTSSSTSSRIAASHSTPRPEKW